MSNELIVKDNSLIEASYSLSTMQQKVLLKAISTIEPNDKDKHIYKFSIKDFAESVNLQDSKSIYAQMKKVCAELTDLKKIHIQKHNGDFIYINWVSSCEYISKEAVVEIEFSKKLMPYLIELKERFTTYYLANVMQLKSGYSIRLFELLKQYEKVGKRAFTLEQLRLQVGTSELNDKGELIREDYELYGHFKTRVLLVAQKELKQKTDICFTFKEIKKGKKVVSIEFEIMENKKNKKLIQNASNYEQVRFDIMHLQQLFKNKVGVPIEYDKMEQLVNDKGFETVKKYIDYWDRFKPQGIRNALAFFIVAVSQEYEIPKEAKKREASFMQREYKDLSHLYTNNVFKTNEEDN